MGVARVARVDVTSSSPARRVAVIGDVAGHIDELRTELERLGASGSPARLPPGLVVIQVGDLIHRGPDSDGVVALVDRYLSDQPDQWIQLVGNHEAHYLRQPVFDWPERISEQSSYVLRRWWADGQMRVAAAVRTGSMGTRSEDFLVTHAGLTAGFWRDVLAAPRDVDQTAAELNQLVGGHDDELFRPGHMLRGRRGNRAAGPIWAAAATELVPSWLGRTLPFSQLHGHTSVVDWPEVRVRASAEIAARTTADPAARHAVVDLDGGRIIGIDPGHGRQAQRPWRAWEIDSATVA